jgi:hypothetical protein
VRPRELREDGEVNIKMDLTDKCYDEMWVGFNWLRVR